MLHSLRKQTKKHTPPPTNTQKGVPCLKTGYNLSVRPEATDTHTESKLGKPPVMTKGYLCASSDNMKNLMRYF